MVCHRNVIRVLTLALALTACQTSSKSEKVGALKTPILLKERPEISVSTIPNLTFEIDLCTDHECGEKTTEGFTKEAKAFVKREGAEGKDWIVSIESSEMENLWFRLAKIPTVSTPMEELGPCKASFSVRILAPSGEWETNVCRNESEASRNLSTLVRDLDYLVLKRRIQDEARSRAPTPSATPQ